MKEKEAPETQSNAKRLLIIDDEDNMRHMLTMLLRKSGYEIDTAGNGQEGLEKLSADPPYDFILCDIKMPRMGGMEFLEAAGEKLQGSTIIMMSAYGNIDTAIEAMKRGAYDYISKPFKSDEVLLALRKAEERERLKRENLRLKKRIRNIEDSYRFGNMIARSKSMQAVFQLSEKVAQYTTTVLITGESGTGKELVARGIHFSSDRARNPLIAVNCGGIPDNLLESEFFGHKKGAFTGADKSHKGLFEEAEGGTIFLDEVGELPASLQVKLLRVLQESEVRPVGDSKTRIVDVRVIAATAKNLEAEVAGGRFRQDLYYRLNVLTIKLPPLRDRREDIALLSQHFINRFNELLGKETKGITPEAMALLLEHNWPGNVRELENVIERAMVLADGPMLSQESFPFESTPPAGGAETVVEPDFDGYSLKDAQKILEKKLITRALIKTGGNRTQAIQLLGISHPSLLTKIKAYDISE